MTQEYRSCPICSKSIEIQLTIEVPTKANSLKPPKYYSTQSLEMKI